MSGVVTVVVGGYLLVSLVVFFGLAFHPANSEFRPLRSFGVALGWLPALVYVQAQTRLGGEAGT